MPAVAMITRNTHNSDIHVNCVMMTARVLSRDVEFVAKPYVHGDDTVSLIVEDQFGNAGVIRVSANNWHALNLASPSVRLSLLSRVWGGYEDNLDRGRRSKPMGAVVRYRTVMGGGIDPFIRWNRQEIIPE